MSPDRSDNSQTGPPDPELIRLIQSGNADALQTMISRYDRLVRFTVFDMSATRCRRDPQWIDAIASAAWTGFIQSMTRGSIIRQGSVASYLVRVTRNQCHSAMRRESPVLGGSGSPETQEGGGPGSPDEQMRSAGSATPEPDPARTVELWDRLECLRHCLDGLTEEQKQIIAQLPEILGRKWSEVARTMEIPESTLRSRWAVLLSDLRSCLEGRTRH